MVEPGLHQFESNAEFYNIKVLQLLYGYNMTGA